MIDRNAKRLRESVDALTHVFGGAVRQSTLACERVNLALVATQAIEAHQSLAHEKGIAIHLHGGDRRDFAWGDPAKLANVVSNLLSNAIKFSEEGAIHVRLSEVDKEIKFAVTDSGAGLVPEEASKIFDRFYQTAAGRRKKGTGSGLTIAKGWVEAHGGRIWAESDGVGKGATVTFTVPAPGGTGAA
jgi:signal transduction histidine kinase